MRKTLAVLTLALLLIAATVGAYYNFIYLPEKRLEERIQPLIDAGLTREKALEFDEAHRDWAPYNKTATEYARYWVDFPVVSEAILETSGSLKYTIPSLDLVVPNIANKTLTQDTLINFMAKHPFLVKDDGLNATDMRLTKYYVHLPGIVNKVIEKIKSQEDRLFALDELTPYISKPLTEEQAYQLIEKWYPDLFKQCKEKGIPVVFGDVDEDGVNHYEEIFTYGTDPFKDDWPPLIKDLKWEPTRVVNSKVYDGTVSFVAEDPKLSEAHLIFAPKNYTHLPKEAFPEEDSRRFSLKPVDGAFDEKLEEFLANVTDIKGGREYEIKVIAKDQAGNIATANLTTPYIREFENIAPLDDILVGAFYYQSFGPGARTWEGTIGNPLLGKYYSGDPLVISKHIDWATGYGIDFLISDFNGPFHLSTKVLKDDFLKNRLISDIKFAISYESHWRLIDSDPGPWQSFNMSDASNIEILLKDFNFLAKTYFTHPSYLKINGNPVVFLYLSRAYTGNVTDTITNLRNHLKEKGHGIYLIGDQVYWGISLESESEKRRMKAYDSITGYIMYTSENDTILDDFESEVDSIFNRSSKVAKGIGMKFIPSAIPGFDFRQAPWGIKDSTPLEKSQVRFGKQLDIVWKYLDPETKMFLISTFNDWHENTYIEPSIEDGFEYLDVLKKRLTAFYLP